MYPATSISIVLLMFASELSKTTGSTIFRDNQKSHTNTLTENHHPYFEEEIFEESLQELSQEDFEVPLSPGYNEDEPQNVSSYSRKRRSHSRKRTLHPWPGALIPYVIWGSERTKGKVLSAFSKVETNTCVRFVPRGSESRYVVIKEDDGGCWSSGVGYPSSDKRVIVGLGKGCRGPGRILHEVMHAAGFVHEQSRPDRDNFISIQWDNVKEKGRSNFRQDHRYQTLSIPYDFKSIMHYGRYAFAKNRSLPTIVPKESVTGSLGGSSLTPLDIQKINTFYQC